MLVLILGIFFLSCIRIITCGPFLNPRSCPELVFNKTQEKIVKPVIFVPGLGGSVLEAKFENVETKHLFCRKNRDWFWFWINLEELIPDITSDCFMNNLRMHFDPSTESLTSTKGVTLRPYDIGGTKGVEYISNVFQGISCYMNNVVEYFVDGGYVKGETFRAMPFDFRLGPKEWREKNGEFETLKNLIEDTFKKTGGQKVVVMGHSLGGPYLQAFFVYFVDQKWKDTYIDRFISVSGSYDGSVDALSNMISGNAEGIWLDFRSVLYSFGGLQWMVPSKFYMDDVVLMTDSRNYTMKEYKELITDAFGTSTGYDIYEYTLKYGNRSAAPGVNTMCLMGDKMKTGLTYYFPDLKDENRKNHSAKRFINGDGTVSAEGLKMCSDWIHSQDQKIVNKIVDKIGHTDLMITQEGVDVIWDAIYEEM